MNAGIFGEGFPYSNFHDLNMDWIIKIAKDFLDQYTHIQEVIAQGLIDIADKTDEGLEALETKYEELNNLLQDWYDTHSEDIVNQLAEALHDLNEWYTTHENYLNQTLADNIEAFDTHAEQKAELTIESIPTDYTDLANRVRDIHTGSTPGNNLIGAMYPITEGKYINNSGTEGTLNILAHTDYIDILGATAMFGHFSSSGAGQNNIGVYYDENKNFIDSIYGTTVYWTSAGQWISVVPNNARYVRLNRLVSNDYTEGNYATISFTDRYNNNQNYNFDRDLFESTYRQLIGIYYNNSGEMTVLSVLACTPYIEIGMNNIIRGKFNYNGSPQTHRGIYYDINKNMITTISDTAKVNADGSYISLIPENAKYVIINHTASADTTEGNYAYLQYKREPIYDITSIAILGDSISAGYGVQSDQKYVSIIEQRFGITINNQSVSGSEISTNDGTTDSFVNRVQNISNCDICFVFGGTNDYWHHNTPINGDAHTSLEGALKAVLTYLYDVVGVQHVVVVTPFKQYYNDHYGLNYDMGYGTLTDFVNKIIDVAHYYSADVIDLYNGNNIGAIPETPVRTNRLLQDGVHPTYPGHYVLANIFTQYIKSKCYPKQKK